MTYGQMPLPNYSSALLKSGASDTSREFSATAAAVGFFFSFRSILVLISARGLGVGTEPGVIANCLLGFSLLLLVSFQVAGRPLQPIASIWRVSTMRWVFGFLAFSLCSLAWTASISPVASSMYWLTLAFDVATVALLYQMRCRTVMHSIIKGFVWGTVLLALLAWLMPLQADLRLGDLEYFNTNQIGNLCAIAIFLCQIHRAERAGASWVLSLILVLTLLRSLSKATIVAFALGQLYLFIRNRWLSRKQKLTLAACAAFVILAFGGLFESYLDVYSTAGNQAETLTGRTAIWAYSLDAALQKPWFGNGIDAMWKVFPPFGSDMFEARHAENELLQQFFAYGMMGVILLVGLYGSLYRRVRSLPAGVSRTTLIAFLIFIVVRGLAEAEPFDLLLPLWLITALSMATAAPTAVGGVQGHKERIGRKRKEKLNGETICGSLQV